MTLSIKNGGYAFSIRLDLMLSMSLWKASNCYRLQTTYVSKALRINWKKLNLNTQQNNLALTLSQ